MDISLYIQKVVQNHPEFHEWEIEEILNDFLSSYPKKTKESTLAKNLDKFLEKEFGITEAENCAESFSQVNNHALSEKEVSKITFSSFIDNIPAKYFSSNKNKFTSEIINISWLYKNIFKTELFEDANLRLFPNEKYAIIWRNWVWKSTLLKIILWTEDVNKWNIDIAKWLRIWYLSQDIFHNKTTRTLVEELSNLSSFSTDLELEDYELEILINKQMSLIEGFWFSKDDLHRDISSFSGWELTKVQIIKFLILDADLLILDEPTNHLDIEWIIFLEKFVKRREKWLLCITHDKSFLNNCFNRIIEISNLKINSFEWNYDQYLEHKEKQLEIQTQRYNDQQKYLQKQYEFIERFRYKSSKASQVQSRIKMLDKLEKIELPEHDNKVYDIKMEIDIRLPNVLLSMHSLNIWYSWKLLIELPKMIEVNKNRKIWIIWKNWVWKTSLLNTIIWVTESLKWDVKINEKIRIWYFSQISESLNYENTIMNELSLNWVSTHSILWYLWMLLIDEEKVSQKIWTLSWGERAKVALVKMFLEKPHLVILDEPTNHLDIFTKKSIQNFIINFPWVSIVVSHDRDLLSNISNQIWLIDNWKLIVYEDVNRWLSELFNVY